MRARIERLWDGRGVGARAARAALRPLEGAFRAGSALRNTLYDRGVLRRTRAAIPVISVGNLAVGGAGKTPFAAWLARELAALGARPGVVLRGYGADEPLVHRAINPDVPVVVDADRVAGVERARSLGTTVAVLDDGFQHRALERDLDLVLVAADGFRAPLRVLPAGPWREGLTALQRASAVVITRKAADDEAVRRLRSAVEASAPGIPRATVSLAPDALVRLRDHARAPLSALAGRRVLVICGIANPAAFRLQLEALGAHCTVRAFGDHHHFVTADALRLAQDARAHDLAVCTLKDAVKLDALWPRAAAPLWYVSQRLEIEEGADALRDLLRRVLPPANATPRGRPSIPPLPI